MNDFHSTSKNETVFLSCLIESMRRTSFINGISNVLSVMFYRFGNFEQGESTLPEIKQLSQTKEVSSLIVYRS